MEKMPLSYRVIKNSQVDPIEDNIEIPILSSEGFKNHLPEEIALEQKKILQNTKKAQKIIEEAERKSQEILHRTKQEAEDLKEQILQEAFQKGTVEGQKKGYQDGYSKGIEESQEIQKEAKQVLKSAHRESREYIRKTKEEIIQLAASMAENIIKYSINLEDENIVNMVNNALRKVEERKQIIIRCHPENVLLLEVHINQFKKICPNGVFTILEDKGKKLEEVIIETEAQIIHLDIDKQLENIKTALMEMSEQA